MLPTDIDSNKTGGPPDDIGRLIPRKRVAEELGVCARSVVRRENYDPAFPKLIKINGRVYVSEEEFSAYKRTLIHRGLEEVF
jgi:hypothetical protein